MGTSAIGKVHRQSMRVG